jgi:hypothetical protein
MKRIGFIIVLLVTMAVAAPTGAHPLAGGETKRAILASLKAPGRVGLGNDGASDWIYVDHRIHRRWRHVGPGGEGIPFDCRRARMLRQVAHDLRIQCR